MLQVTQKGAFVSRIRVCVTGSVTRGVKSCDCGATEGVTPTLSLGRCMIARRKLNADHASPFLLQDDHEIRRWVKCCPLALDQVLGLKAGNDSRDRTAHAAGPGRH